MRNVRYILLFILLAVPLIAQTIYTQKDEEICNSKFQLSIDKKYSKLPINDVIIEIGKSFLGTDYEANTLEKGDVEKLVIYLTGLDCYTFLESSLVFARCIKMGKTTFGDYQNELTNIRYRNGKLDEYPSRLHYFSDWIYEMDKRGIGKDITQELGGIPYKKEINFMSTHIASYVQLKKNPKFIEDIMCIEQMINSRKYFYIPQPEIKKVESRIQGGDIIGITTNVEGLDIAHTGIAIRMKNGRIHLMHAPNTGNKVQISEKPLAEYIIGNEKQTGIMVLRIN